MDTKIRSDVRADPPSARAFPEIQHKTKLKKNPSTSKTKQEKTNPLQFTTDFKLIL